MIVTCQECSTSFQLDDARIPATGARVRCSRCKHAFFLPNPSASQSAAVQAVVEQVVGGALGGTPEPTRDLRPAGRTERGSALRTEPEEEDWQFSQEIRIAGDEEPEEIETGVADAPKTPATPRADSFDLTGDFGRGFDPETFSPDKEPSSAPDRAVTEASAEVARSSAPAAASAGAAKAASSTGERDESGFGSVDDFSSLIEDDDLSIDLATEQTPTADTRSPARAPARRTGGGAAEDLGDPESWDLVGGETQRRASSTVAALAGPKPGPLKPGAAAKSPSAGLDLFADTELPPARIESDASNARAGLRLAALGRALGWGVTLACVASVLALLIRPEWSRRATEPQRLEIGPFVAETDRAGWLESSRSGLLLVFEGELRNTGATPLRPIPLQLSLLDRSGQLLSDPPIEVGMPLDASTLREAAPQVLAARRAEAVSTWLAAPLSPGEVRRFVAVATVDEIPVAARRVQLAAGRADGR